MISRRTLVMAGPLAVASCGKREPYFGKLTPPPTQTLIYEIDSEPSSLDPATSLASSEAYILPALLEGLLSLDTHTLQPCAALATHYEVDAGMTEFTFFLRGHPKPRGTKLPGARPASSRAVWSDGRPVIADDFVRAWRRVADPTNGGLYGVFLQPLAHAKEIAEGKARPEALGVQAIDDLTLHVSLATSAAHFLQLATDASLAAIPHHAVARSGSSRTALGRTASCGPFVLHEWKAYDRIVLRKNTQYYNAHRVQLEEIIFVPVTDGAIAVNLYKAGNAHAMHGRAVPPLWIPALSDRKDFHRVPAYRSYFYPFNTTLQPFDNRLVRYAFQMATDKNEIVRFLSGGQTVALTVVPPVVGYEGIRRLPIEAGGRVWDVLSYDPEAARALLNLAGAGRLVFDLTFPIGPRSKDLAQILQKQWHANLGAEVSLIAHETNVWIQTLQSVAYHGVIECNWTPPYMDPNGMLELFNGRNDGSGWKDPEFRQMLNSANAEPDPAARMRKLATCEERLMSAMPVLPLFFDSYAYLQKPYVKGMSLNALDLPAYKDVWIDTNWKPS